MEVHSTDSEGKKNVGAGLASARGLRASLLGFDINSKRMYFILSIGNKKESMMTANQKRVSFLMNCFGIITILLLFSCNPCISAEVGNRKADGEENNIYNIHNTDMGKVAEDRIIFNRHGRSIGSVDEEGVIYNVSKIVIGRVESNGSVRNQSGTILGSVNEKGEIFNISKRKLGVVKDISDIKLIGATARLIFLK